MNFAGLEDDRLVRGTMTKLGVLADEDPQEHSVTRRVHAWIELSIAGLAQVPLRVDAQDAKFHRGLDIEEVDLFGPEPLEQSD
jgi:hypothetical protein